MKSGNPILRLAAPAFSRLNLRVVSSIQLRLFRPSAKAVSIPEIIASAEFFALALKTASTYNFDNKNLENLNVKGKTSILNELSNIIGEENISTLTSNINQLNIKYKTKREFKNNVNENCKELQFFDFKLNDINIDEAIFCEDKLIKLKFYKGDLKPI